MFFNLPDRPISSSSSCQILLVCNFYTPSSLSSLHILPEPAQRVPVNHWLHAVAPRVTLTSRGCELTGRVAHLRPTCVHAPPQGSLTSARSSGLLFCSLLSHPTANSENRHLVPRLSTARHHSAASGLTARPLPPHLYGQGCSDGSAAVASEPLASLPSLVCLSGVWEEQETLSYY